jgi:hypothetical protein
MSQTPNIGSLTGTWTYRSFNNDPNLSTPFERYVFGSGYLIIRDAPMSVLQGKIGEAGTARSALSSTLWATTRLGRQLGQGLRVVGAELRSQHITIVRTIPHSGANMRTVNPAGVTACWIAVWKAPLPNS